VRARRRFAAALAASVIFAGTTVLVARFFESREAVSLPSSVVEDVVPATAPPQDAGPGQIVHWETSKECPEMDNPGGLPWKRTANAGPFPTGGSVVLPSLRVDAPIVKVGVGMDGQMVVPRNARDVAWLDQGGIPGDTNNVVIAGHISYSRQAGSFFRLRELAKGDNVTVAMGGKHYKYRVVWNCFFDRNTTHAAQIMGKTDVPSVTLISCGGVFDSAARTHSQRIAVRAEMYSGPTPKPERTTTGT
jgi:LPXTG-site transpeptidase (sortase) family protein